MQIIRQKHFQGRGQPGSEAGAGLLCYSRSEGASVAGVEREEEPERRGNEGPEDEGHSILSADLGLLVMKQKPLEG